MSKVNKEIVQAAIMKLAMDVGRTMPTSLHKFVYGGATAFATIKGSAFIDSMLQFDTDENGLVDVDVLKKIVEVAFQQSEGKVQIPLFQQSNNLMSMFLAPVTVTICKEDIDKLFAEIEANSLDKQTQAIGAPTS